MEEKTVEQSAATEGMKGAGKLRKKPLIDPASCYGCSLCIVNCRFDCLSISQPRHRGDIRTYAVLELPDKCVGCGLCSKACPVDAIEMVEE